MSCDRRCYDEEWMDKDLDCASCPGRDDYSPKNRASIEQQVQLDSEQKQGTFDNPVDAAVSVAPRELT